MSRKMCGEMSRQMRGIVAPSAASTTGAIVSIPNGHR